MKQFYLKKIFIFSLLTSLFVSFSFLVLAQDMNELLKKKISERNVSSSNVRSFQKNDIDRIDPLPVSPLPTPIPGGADNAYYNVHVLGQVKRPGVYKVFPSDRVTDAVKYAGEILFNGSETKIELKRNNSTQIVNLFSYKYQGSLKNNPYLIENDVVFVPLKKGEIEIEGPVARPGFYEIDNEVGVSEAIKMAGGFTVGHAEAEPIRVIRYSQSGEKRIIEIKEGDNNLKNFKLQKGDVLVAPHILLTKNKFDYNMKRIPGDNIFYPTTNESVYVIGAVAMPGPFDFQPGAEIQTYVSQAGATHQASLNNLQIINHEGKRFKPKKHAQINPGDTIIVPDKAITFTKAITLFNSLTSSAITTFFFYDRFN